MIPGLLRPSPGRGTTRNAADGGFLSVRANKLSEEVNDEGRGYLPFERQFQLGVGKHPWAVRRASRRTKQGL